MVLLVDSYCFIFRTEIAIRVAAERFRPLYTLCYIHREFWGQFVVVVVACAEHDRHCHQQQKLESAYKTDHGMPKLVLLDTNGAKPEERHFTNAING